MNVIPINPHADPRWIEFLSRHPDATIFHHPSWLKVIESTYAYTPVCLGVEDGGKLVGIFPLLEIRSWLTGKRAVCLPFSDACMPLGDHADAIGQLLSAAADLRGQRGWKYVEIRGNLEHASLNRSAQFKTHVTTLQSDSDNVFRTFKKTQIQQRITKSIRSGVTVERGDSLAALQEFIRLNGMTRKKLGVPPQPDALFLNLREILISKGQGFISTASFEGRIIAASVFLFFQGSIYYKYSASDEEYLAHRPNNLIVWDAIRWGCENGCTRFDFGRTDADSEGLLDYKRGWGTTESDLNYYRISDEQQASVTTTDALERVKPILRIVPVPVLKLIGRLLYGHVG